MSAGWRAAGGSGPTAASFLVPLIALLVYWPATSAGFVGDDLMILHRLARLSAPTDVLQFFGAEFFEYYRPLGFVAHAIDYGLAGPTPRQFHVTNLLLHAISTTFVLLIARRLSPGSLAGPVAALLFALHTSNHEAVVWVSARFDLLATTFALAALWLVLREGDRHVLPALLFVMAILSKESAVALPLAVAAWSTFVLNTTTAETLRRTAPWLVALVFSAALRQLGGGVSAIGGPSRLPKLLVFAALLALAALLAGGRWTIVRDRLLARRRLAVAGLVVVLLLAGILASTDGAAGRFAAEKLAVAGFAVFHLLSPLAEVSETPFYREPSTLLSRSSGLALAALAGVIVLALWHRLLGDPRMWFLAACLAATLLPISALTEGKRYLYLPSAIFAIALGVLVAEIRRPLRSVALAVVGVVLVVSTIEISRKVQDWRWAGQMTAAGSRLVTNALAPACETGHVVFLTGPVAVRGVYTHFYYETFEWPHACRPGLFQVVARAAWVETTADVQWEDAARIAIVIPRYDGHFILSEDLRHFDRPLPRGVAASIETPLGTLRADPVPGDGVRLTLTLTPELQEDPPLFFYYSDGEMRRLPES